MSLDKATVRRIAQLARLRVDEERLAPLAQELNNILGWIEQLNEVDTAGVAPMTSVVEMTLARRRDHVTDGALADQVTANGPETEGSFFVVPKVVE